jgi:hypothetical protein
LYVVSACIDDREFRTSGHGLPVCPSAVPTGERGISSLNPSLSDYILLCLIRLHIDHVSPHQRAPYSKIHSDVMPGAYSLKCWHLRPKDFKVLDFHSKVVDFHSKVVDFNSKVVDFNSK